MLRGKQLKDIEGGPFIKAARGLPLNTVVDEILDVQHAEWATHIGDFTYGLDF